MNQLSDAAAAEWSECEEKRSEGCSLRDSLKCPSQKSRAACVMWCFCFRSSQVVTWSPAERQSESDCWRRRRGEGGREYWVMSRVESQRSGSVRSNCMLSDDSDAMDAINSSRLAHRDSTPLRSETPFAFPQTSNNVNISMSGLYIDLSSTSTTRTGRHARAYKYKYEYTFSSKVQYWVHFAPRTELIAANITSNVHYSANLSDASQYTRKNSMPSNPLTLELFLLNCSVHCTVQQWRYSFLEMWVTHNCPLTFFYCRVIQL